MKTKLKLHPLCELFPQLPDAEIAELGADIKAHKQRDPIILLDGKVLDGRNRLMACEAAGVKPRFENFTGADPLSFVISKNLTRRHLDTSQRAMLAAEIAKLRQGEKSNPQNCVLQDEAAAKLNVSTRLVQTAKTVVDKGSKGVRDLVKGGEVSVSAAAAVSTRFSKAKQAKIAARGADAVKAAASKLTRPPEARDHSGAYTSSPAIKRGTLPPRRNTGDFDEPLPRNDLKPGQKPTLSNHAAQDAVERIEWVYETEKAWFNSLPPRTPRAIVDKLIEGLRG